MGLHRAVAPPRPSPLLPHRPETVHQPGTRTPRRPRATHPRTRDTLGDSRRHELAIELLERFEPDKTRARWLDEETRRRVHELLPDLDRPSPRREPPPPGPDLDTGMDFGP